MNKEIKFTKQSPSFYAGDALHAIKQERIQKALEQSGFDAFLLCKAEAVRWVTDFYVKGFRPFLEPEYVVLVVKGKPLTNWSISSLVILGSAAVLAAKTAFFACVLLGRNAPRGHVMPRTQNSGHARARLCLPSRLAFAFR